jgi:hypothetical protein
MNQRALLLFVLLLPVLTASSGFAAKSKYSCDEVTPETYCTAANTCGSASAPCQIDVQKKGQSATATPNISDPKKLRLFCIKEGTNVVFMTTNKHTGFVVGFGDESPFDPNDDIIGGAKKEVSVTAKRHGCYKYSVGACYSGAIYGMCGSGRGEAVILP